MTKNNTDMAEENKKTKGRMKGDTIIWAVFFFLCIVSIIEVFSAASELTSNTSYLGPMLKHTMLIGVGVVFLVITMNIDCRYFKIITPFALLISFVMLLVTSLTGGEINGASRWFDIGGIQFQPSELAKGAVVLAEVMILSALQDGDTVDKRAFKYILWVSVPFILLIFRENFSTAALLGLVVILLMFIGRVPLKQIGKLLGVIMLAGMIGFGAIWALGENTDEEQLAKNDPRMKTEIVNQPENKKSGGILHRFGTWKNRIKKFVNDEEVAPEKFDLDKDGQVAHANIAIASSNLVGKGPGNSVQRDWLPQAFSDFIYAIIIEEMGLWGAVGVCLLYLILLFRTAKIANRCAYSFPALLIMGLALLMVTQAIFNMMVAVGLAPVTGQPLPLISKGGTSTIINCVYIGVIMSVSTKAKKKEDCAECKTVSIEG
ncbi:MAG: FtsW/RodA/SpoVE family cell cycle protein [Prevotella sp.]|uniref:FtsW/RodA/SpoVE family cell cycle protein n=1 Tax=Prevotella sp. TaxID=59823 RepID=UPI002A334CCE|nr:FtsW/RodA/SpoVE family cell cycle protein [Prevotella sp.]MDD7318565.1 FtsW/RodA/SpoVE family cell cycle protein [Prevotellaceae bacterium]MDY4020366.1 FtsW/RodA/SpoVE family cell cycle protein [Prevotella sp.]